MFTEQLTQEAVPVTANLATLRIGVIVLTPDGSGTTDNNEALPILDV